MKIEMFQNDYLILPRALYLKSCQTNSLLLLK